MKNIVLLFLFLVPVFLFAQYPTGTNKSRLGYQTTGDGLIWRGVAADTAIKPRTTANAYFQLDTVNRVLRRYIATQGSWQVVGGTSGGITPADTAAMLSAYISLAGYGLSKTAIHTLGVDTTLISTKTYTNRFLLKSDTAAMLSKYIERGDTSGMLSAYIRYAGWGLLKTSHTLTVDSSKVSTRYYTGTNFFPLQGGTLTGTGGAGFIGFPSQVSAPGTPASGLNVYAQGSSFNWKGTDGYERQFASTLTGGRTYTLPNISGTFTLGTGTANLVPLWTATNTLGNSNIQDNGTAVSILNSKPFMLGQWTTASRPTGVNGYVGFNTSFNWVEYYSSSGWFSPMQSSLAGGIGTSTRILHNDANGRATDNANLTYSTNLNLLGNTNGNLVYSITNSSSGTSATSGLLANANNSKLALFGQTSSGYTANTNLSAQAGFIYTDGAGGLALWPAAGTLRFITGSGTGTERMRITTTGSVGVGNFISATVDYAFHVRSNSATDVSLIAENIATGASATSSFGGKNDVGKLGTIGVSSSTYSAITAIGPNTGYIYSDATNGFSITSTVGAVKFHVGGSTSAAEKMRLTTSGLLGLGNSNPQRTFHVTGEVRITDLTTDTPTQIVGADVDGDLGALTTGSGISIVAGVLGLAADSLDQNAGVLYVSKNGNNSTGKRNNPRRAFLTIKAAATASKPGDLIYIYPGVYREGGNTLGRDSINFYCSSGVTVSNAVITDDYGTSDMDNGGYVRWFGSGVFDSCLVSIQHMNMRYHIEGDSINLTYIPFWKQVNYNDIRLKLKFRSVRTLTSQLVWIPGKSAELTYTRMNLIFEIDKIYSPSPTKNYPLIHFANGAGGTDSDAKSKFVDCNFIFDIKNIEITGAAAVGSFPRLQGLIFGAGGVVGRVHLQRSNITFNSDYIVQTGSSGNTYNTPFQGFENSHTLFGLGTFKLDSSRLNFNIKSIYADIHAFRIGEMHQGNKGMININGNFNTRSLATFHIEETESGATGDTSVLIRVNGNFSSDKEVVTCRSTVPIEKITWQGNYTSFADKAVFAIKSDRFTLSNAVLKNYGTTADIYAAEARTIKVGGAFADGLNLSANVSTPSLENIGSPKLETYYKVTSTSSPQTLSNTYTDNLIDQGGTQATFTLTFPASPIDGQVLKITYNNAITTLTLDGNGNTIVGSAVTTGVAGSQRAFKFYTGIGWIKLY